MSQTFWLVQWERCDLKMWRWGSTVLTQLPAPPWHLCSVPPSPLSSCRRAPRAGCACVNKTGQKTWFTQEACTRLSIKESGSGPLTLFSLSISLSFSQPQLQTLQHTRTNAGSEDWWYSLYSLSLFFLYFSPPLLCLGKTWLSYSTSHIELCCGCKELAEVCCGFWASTFE